MNKMRCGTPWGVRAMAVTCCPDMGCSSPCAKVQKVFERKLLPSYLQGFGEFSAFL